MKSYEDGLNEAWRTARKIACAINAYGGSRTEVEKIFDSISISNILCTNTASEAIAKIKKYEEIKVGDEVVNVTGKKSVVVQVEGLVITIVESDGIVGRWSKEDFQKTGRHYTQIEEVLKQMKEGEDE